MNNLHEKLNYMTTECSLKMGRSNPGTGGYHSHWHDSIELIYGFENEYSITAGPKNVMLHSNDIVFIPSRILHSFYMENQPSRLYFLQFKVLPMYVGGDIDRQKKSDDLLSPIVKNLTIISKSQHPELHGAMVKVVEEIISVMEQCKTGYRYIAVSKLYNILGLLAEHYVTTPSFYEDITAIDLDILMQAIDYIEKKFSEHVTIDDVANHIGFNPKYFGRLFYKVTGSYFNDYVNDFRVKKVADMLLKQYMSVSTAAYSCGFTNLATFYRCFNKCYNCSPRQYISKYKT